MAPKFLIQSIPHSGTRFTSGLFWHIGDIEYEVRHFNADMPKHPYILTPLRDPYMIAISNVYGHESKARHGMPLELVNAMYDVFIRQSNEKRFVYIDIDCPEDKRLSHLIAVLKQLEVYDDAYLPTITWYADRWKPVGATDYEWKRKYLETGELPDCVRHCDLQRAINWYNKVKQECIYDYIT